MHRTPPFTLLARVSLECQRRLSLFFFCVCVCMHVCMVCMDVRMHVYVSIYVCVCEIYISESK